MFEIHQIDSCELVIEETKTIASFVFLSFFIFEKECIPSKNIEVLSDNLEETSSPRAHPFLKLILSAAIRNFCRWSCELVSQVLRFCKE